MTPLGMPRHGPLAILRQWVRPRSPMERCELCSAPIASRHEHLVDPASRQILCSCDPCAILFSSQHSSRYRRVPREGKILEGFRMADGQWEALHIPINLAFFFHSSPVGNVIALYPSPAGATESLLTLETWESLVQDNPILRKMEPDVEALLVNRLGLAQDYYLMPIDECYKLVGIIRSHWRGLSGGTEVWREIGLFFSNIKDKCHPNREDFYAGP